MLEPKRTGAEKEVPFDAASCERLLGRVRSTAEPPWRELASLLWPEITRLIRRSRGMVVLARSEDHVHNVALLVLEKLGKDGCRAVLLYAPWRDAHPDKTFDDWLRIVTANVIRDYVRERSGRSARRGGAEGAAPEVAEPIDKRLLHSLATLLPDDDDLPFPVALSATSRLAARDLAGWAKSRLPGEQLAALSAWLEGTSFEDMAAELSIADAATAKKLVRAAIASLRRHALAA